MPTNNMGPWQLASNLQYGGTPPPTGNLVPPQSPSGSVTGQSATWNFANGETSTHFFLDTVLNVESAQQGATVLNAPNSFAGGPLPANAVNSYRWE